MQRSSNCLDIGYWKLDIGYWILAESSRKLCSLITSLVQMFSGTVKENLDPLGEYSERELLAALKGVQLWDVLAGVSFSQAKAADVAAEPRPVASSPVNTSMASSVPIGIMGEH